MNDAQLIRRLRELDAPGTPRAAFADALFAYLRRDLPWRSTRSLVPSVGMSLAAGAALAILVAVIVIALLGAGPPGPAAPTDTPTASPSSTPASPSSSAVQSPAGWRPGALPPFGDVPVIAGLREGQVWALVSIGTGNETGFHVVSYDVSSDRWTDGGRILDQSGHSPPSITSLGASPEGLFVLGHAETERLAWPVDPDTLVGVTPRPPPSGSAFVYPRAPLRAPDGRFYILEALGAPLSTPVTLLSYDPAADEWRELAPIPEPRIRPLIAMDPTGGVYVLGGWTHGSPIRSVARLDPATGEWTAQPDLPDGALVGGQRFGDAAAFGPDGHLYVFAFAEVAVGSASGNRETATYRLDPDAGQWTTVGPPHAPIEPHDAVLADDGSIVLVGHDLTAEGPPATWIYRPDE